MTTRRVSIRSSLAVRCVAGKGDKRKKKKVDHFDDDPASCDVRKHDVLSVGHSPVYVCTGFAICTTWRVACDASYTYGSNLELSCSESGVTVSVPFLSDDWSSVIENALFLVYATLQYTYSPVCNFERCRSTECLVGSRNIRRPVDWKKGPCLSASVRNSPRQFVHCSMHSIHGQTRVDTTYRPVDD